MMAIASRSRRNAYGKETANRSNRWTPTGFCRTADVSLAARSRSPAAAATTHVKKRSVTGTGAIAR
jgi:hypothetical protein